MIFDMFGRHFHEVVAFWLHVDVFVRHSREVVAFGPHFDVFMCHFREVVACSMGRRGATCFHQRIPPR